MPTPTTSGSCSTISMSGYPFVDALLYGTCWTSSTITYSFPNASSVWSTDPLSGYGPITGYDSEPWSPHYEALSASEANRFTSALQTWSNVANLNFVLVNDDTTTVGDIRVAYSYGDDAQAWAYAPNNTPYGGDVWINSNSTSYHNPANDGSYAFFTFIHELGHALGLKHPFAQSAYNSTTMTGIYSDLDSVVTTVMSYSAAPGNWSTHLSYNPTTPMVYDILAIQVIYGENTSYHTGDDIYNFSTNGDYLQTIWDAGGNDTIVCTGSESVMIDLNEGCGSRIGNSVYVLNQYGIRLNSVSNVWIAYGAMIENATSGSGNDTLTGNQLNNILTGGLGNDTLKGRTGNDTLNGGDGWDQLEGDEGNDILDGGAGWDFLLGGTGNDTYLVDLKTIGTGITARADLEDMISDSSGIDTLALRGTAAPEATIASTLYLRYGIENLDASATSSTKLNLIGNFDNNVITGNAADNFIDGGFGSDLLIGGAGNDTLSGADGNDTLIGGIGTDTLIGGLGNDTYIVDNTGDVVTELLSAGTDTIESSVTYTLSANVENLALTGSGNINGRGNELANILIGNAGANVLTGGLGNDTYIISSGDSIVEALNGGIDLVQSDISHTLAANVENLTLTGSVNIEGTGNELANIITGNASNNILDGGQGIDVLKGGAGNDTYKVDLTTANLFQDTVTENLNEGTDTLILRGGNTTLVTVSSLTLGANLENLDASGTGSSKLNLTGNGLDNILTGNNAANILDGGIGTDTLIGGLGNDCYIFSRGCGSDTVRENDTTLGNRDITLFSTGIATNQIWMRHVGDDLEVSIIGTSDKLTFDDWYLGSQYHTEQFKTADNRMLLDSQVENLVQAMAAFSPPASGQTTLPLNYQSALSPIIAANWQ